MFGSPLWPSCLSCQSKPSVQSQVRCSSCLSPSSPHSWLEGIHVCVWKLRFLPPSFTTILVTSVPEHDGCFHSPSLSIMTLKAFQGRKMMAFFFYLKKYFYCKPAVWPVLQIKILMLQKRTVISFLPCLVYLWRGLTFFALPKQFALCDGILLFFPLQPRHVGKKKKWKGNQCQLKDGYILHWVNKVTVYWQKVPCIGFFIGLELPAPINQYAGLPPSQCFQTAARELRMLKCNE